MKLTRWVVGLALVAATALALRALQGTAPRSMADKYAAHAEGNGLSVGATLLTAGDLRKAFKTDVDHCCRVVEVAVYPSKNGHEVALGDFTLEIVGEDMGAKPSTPKVVAWRSSRESDRLRPTLILAMEQELLERALPLGHTTEPVSGYLYFEFPGKVKNAKYQLEYAANGSKLVLPFN